MKLSEAKTVKVGDLVACPEDRGDASYIGRVTHTTGIEQTHTLLDEPFLWISVIHNGRVAVWPSNRLGKR